NEVACLMLGSMSPDLQRALENYKAYDMIQEMKTMFEEQAKQELFETVKAFHACKQEDGQSVSSYLLKMKSYLDILERLGYAMPNELRKMIAELHAMLKLHKKGIPKKAETPNVLAIQEDKIQKDKKKPRGEKGKDKGKTKLAYAPKPKIPPLPKRDNPVKDYVCHHYHEGLRGSMKLKHGALNLYVGNGMHAAVEAIHCHLGHINKKCIDKLQRDGILHPTHNESLKKCKSCISGKMARKPFPHQVERAKDLLGLIHTDVCGPFRTMSIEGASYFITFTDDFSRYGYVYLMKHKHGVFETFKVFQNEVKNQLGKKIKAIRSDRGGEYMSHEFVNYMKSCGIVSQLTPPYTPQHNEVFERRNQTLLDMVRSMMNLTTLPKSFWGYALKSAACILNMVPTKKDTQRKRWVTTSTIHLRTRFVLLEMLSSLRIISWYKKRVGVIDFSKSARIPQAQNRYGFYVDVEKYELGAFNEPPNYKAALSDPESDKWLEAMNTEIQSMKDNQVWVLVDLHPNVRTVGNYGETFSPVADIRAIRILLAIAVFYDYEIWQMDVKPAFLNGHQSEDIYMVPLEGFVDPKHPNKLVAFLVLYVDDILLMGNNVTMLQEVKSWLCKCFSIKDLGEAAYILGIKIIRDRSKRLIALSQSVYFDKILKKIKMENSKKGYTLMVEKSDYRKMQRVPYASAIGSIMYAQNPGEIHWTAVKTIFKYLRNTKDMVLVYGAKPETELKVSCYVDASFQTDKDNTKSQTGYVFILNGGAVDWKSAKQSTAAMSSTKAEYIDAAKASMEVVWMRKFIDGLGGVVPSNKRPMEMLCDNEPVITIANDPGILKGARHFQRKYHYIREVIQEREIILKKVHTHDNVVDLFTKPMPYNKRYEHAMAIEICPASSLM
ncbi:retrotransposon protein, putative, ty1-copia subclass, partial [Tanacetum coccineum]